MVLERSHDGGANVVPLVQEPNDRRDSHDGHNTENDQGGEQRVGLCGGQGTMGGRSGLKTQSCRGKTVKAQSVTHLVWFPFLQVEKKQNTILGQNQKSQA